MPLLIGMDEAGYGPNLGPLVVSVVAWEIPGDVRQVDLWQEFDGIISPEPSADGAHLQIADSKVVYTPARGLAALETGVLGACSLWRRSAGESPAVEIPRTFRRLRELVTAQTLGDGAAEPWCAESDIEIPHATADSEDRCKGHHSPLVEKWETRCRERGIRLRSMRSDVVSPEQFNERTRRHDSKGQALTEISMRVLAQVWQEVNADGKEPALIIADKHGGRNRYHDFLPLVFGDRFIRCRAEGADSSRYQVGPAEIRFETKSERHLPVALASMMSKYLRELSMVLFNRFWTTRLPGLKPTAGYPLDARRYREEIAAVQRELGIADDILWRER
ncbi:MAG TPA: hypothetical protein VL475_11625 [Planctomycetaceae bacterium]|jgi:ribonuclease HII|nr:hypothetical protein [Planctomycetaceae bacterium]